MTCGGKGPVESEISLPDEPSAADETRRLTSPAAAPRAERLSASRLHDIASRLGVPVAAFFEEATRENAPDQRSAAARAEEVRRLAAAFDRIADPLLRRSILELAEGLAARGDDAGGMDGQA